MNERIKQLAEQAGFYFDEYNEPTNRKADLFAELIIKECADIATMNQFQWDSTGSYVLKHFEEKL
jgi:hypothetical protein